MKQPRLTNRSSHPQSHAPRSQAQLLDSDTRAFLEPRFGHSFGDVRVYADGQADQLAQSYQARALTVGQDVFFSRGAYSPNTPEGMHLLAHELTHTIQQRGAKPHGKALGVGSQGDSSEREASRASSRVMMGQTATVQGSAGLGVQCFRGADDDWKQNRDDLERSRNANAMMGIPVVGNIGGQLAGTAEMLNAGYNSLAGNDREAQIKSLRAQQLFLKSVPGIGNDLAIRDAIRDQQAIDNLDSDKLTTPKRPSLVQRDGQIKQFNQNASDGARGLWDSTKDGVRGLKDGTLDTAKNIAHGARDGVMDAWDFTRDGVTDTWNGVRDGVGEISDGLTDTWNGAREDGKDLWNGATDTPAPVKTNAAQSVVEHSLSQGFEHGATRGKIAPPSGPIVETFSNAEPWLPKSGE